MALDGAFTGFASSVFDAFTGNFCQFYISEKFFLSGFIYDKSIIQRTKKRRNTAAIYMGEKKNTKRKELIRQQMK